jgi:hypothetical protein
MKVVLLGGSCCSRLGRSGLRRVVVDEPSWLPSLALVCCAATHRAGRMASRVDRGAIGAAPAGATAARQEWPGSVGRPGRVRSQRTLRFGLVSGSARDAESRRLVLGRVIKAGGPTVVSHDAERFLRHAAGRAGAPDAELQLFYGNFDSVIGEIRRKRDFTLVLRSDQPIELFDFDGPETEIEVRT